MGIFCFRHSFWGRDPSGRLRSRRDLKAKSLRVSQICSAIGFGRCRHWIAQTKSHSTGAVSNAGAGARHGGMTKFSSGAALASPRFAPDRRTLLFRASTWGLLLNTVALVNDVTCILERVQQGDPKAADELLPLVYDELRKLAAHKMANEPAGHTLQPTALVHEAWLRLVDSPNRYWNSRNHFFMAAAEAMRRILIERARQKARLKRGGDQQRVPLNDLDLAIH